MTIFQNRKHIRVTLPSRGGTGDGFTGSQGSTGFTGSQGDIGYTGSQGNTGYTGSASTVVGYTGSLGYTGSQGTGFTGSQVLKVFKEKLDLPVLKVLDLQDQKVIKVFKEI